MPTRQKFAFNYRRIAQWTLLLVLVFFWIRTIFDKNFFFDFEACCPFGGLQSIATLVNSGSLACTMDGLQVVMGGLLALSVILVSKLFCGYVCPVGTVSEGLGRLGRKLRLPSIEPGRITDIILRSGKYILLFIVFHFTLASNDLFCQKFDPFFATFSLFGEDVVPWMALLSLVILIVGAIFLKQFWCRYFCPLGAISSAFRYFYVFVIYAATVILLKQAGIEIGVNFILASLAILAYLLEIVGLRRRMSFQLLKIRRDEDVCINCGICDKKCPQAIKVSEMKVVNHPDCNLCGECIGVCPNDLDAVSINGRPKFRWLPILITIVIIMVGLILGANLEVPTIDLTWGDKEQQDRSQTFEMSGLKHIKCYGSSVAFADQMKKVPGVTGVATYTKDHRVVVSYDTTMLDNAGVRKNIFSPGFMDIKIPNNKDQVYIHDFHIENFFDQLDVIFIANLIEPDDGIYSFQTIYGDPVVVRFYTDSLFDAGEFSQSIEQSNLVYSTAEESFSSEDLYKVASIENYDTVLTGAYLKSLSFPSFKRAFNNRNAYTNDQLGSIVFPISSYPANQQLMPYIINHLGKANPYIVGLISQYGDDGPIAVVFYVKDKTTEEDVIDLMLRDKIKVSYDNGFVEELDNPYTFEIPSR